MPDRYFNKISQTSFHGKRFLVRPAAAAKVQMDARLPVFEAGRDLVAFDGAALPLLELFRRKGG